MAFQNKANAILEQQKDLNLGLGLVLLPFVVGIWLSVLNLHRIISEEKGQSIELSGSIVSNYSHRTGMSLCFGLAATVQNSMLHGLVSAKMH